MNNMLKRLCVILAVVLLWLPFGAFADGGINLNHDVALTIVYSDEEQPIANADFGVYRVADTDEYAKMTLKPEFAAYPIDFANIDQDGWQDYALTLTGYVYRDGLKPAASGLTDADGKLNLSLKPGLYLVIGEPCVNDDGGTYYSSPFMVFLPMRDEESGEWLYSVTAKPKNTTRVTAHKILKKWIDEGYVKEHPPIYIDLFCDGELYETIEMSDESGWVYEWEEYGEPHVWTVAEHEISGYWIWVRQQGDTLIIQNSYGNPPPGDNLVIQKKLTGHKAEKDGVFTFVLTAQNENNPMPTGSNGKTKEITITGAGINEFGKITFDEPGTYVYTVTEKNGGLKGYTYDDTVYTLTYEVLGKSDRVTAFLTVTVDGKEVDFIVFENDYEPKLPQTGLLWWPVPVLMAAGLILLLIGCVRRKESCDED